MRYKQFSAITNDNIIEPDKNTLLPTAVHITSTDIHCEGTANLNISHHRVDEQTTYLSWFYFTIEKLNNIDELALGMQQGNVVGVSDGSYLRDTQTGTAAAWRIEAQ